MDAQKIKKEIRVAIKQFGEYTWYDKGPGEVMGVGEITDELRKLSGKEIAKIFLELLNIEKEYGIAFINAALVDLQDLPEKEWNDLMLEPEIEILF